MQGIVLFNRPFAIDFDVERMAVTAAGSLSSPAEASSPLRWVALTTGRVSCDLGAPAGVHDGTAVVKQLLAGAKAVELVSALYRAGAGQLKAMLGELSAWMDRHRFASIESFRGRLSRDASEDPEAFERVQYLKRYGRWRAVSPRGGPRCASRPPHTGHAACRHDDRPAIIRRAP